MQLKDILEEGHIEAYNSILQTTEELYREENVFYPIFGLFLKSKTDNPKPAFTMLDLPPDFGPMLNSPQGKTLLHEYFKYQINEIKVQDKEFEPCAFLMITEVWKTKLPENTDMEYFKSLSNEEQYKFGQEEGIRTESLYVIVNSEKGDMTADYDVIRDGDNFVKSSEPIIHFFEKGKGDFNMNKFNYF